MTIATTLRLKNVMGSLPRNKILKKKFKIKDNFSERA